MDCGRSTPSRLATRWKNSSRLNGSLPSGCCSKCRPSSGGSWAASLFLSPRPADSARVSSVARVARSASPRGAEPRPGLDLSDELVVLHRRDLLGVRRSGAVDQAVVALLLGAVGAAEDAAVGLDAVADDPAAAAVAGGCDGMDGVFEAVEGVGGAGHDDLERLVVVADQWAVRDQADVVDPVGRLAAAVDDIGAEQVSQGHARLPVACR